MIDANGNERHAWRDTSGNTAVWLDEWLEVANPPCRSASHSWSIVGSATSTETARPERDVRATPAQYGDLIPNGWQVSSDWSVSVT